MFCEIIGKSHNLRRRLKHDCCALCETMAVGMSVFWRTPNTLHIALSATSANIWSTELGHFCGMNNF